jgi:hypothetical protein
MESTIAQFWFISKKETSFFNIKEKYKISLKNGKNI